MERLEAVDVALLTDAQRIDYAAAWDRCVRFVEARRTRAMAAAAGIAPKDPAADDVVHALAGELTLSPTSSGHEVAFAREMAAVFPETLAAVENGQIPMQYARTMSRETVGLTAEQRAEVERAVLAKAARRKPYQHTAAVRRAVKKIAPRPKPEDPCSPEQERDVRFREAGPWTAGLWAQGPVEKVGVLAALLAAATAVKAPGEKRTIGNRKFDALFDRLTAKATVFVDLVGYVNLDGTITLPSLPGIGDLDADQLAKLTAGGSLRFHNPEVKPPATDAYEWTAEQRRYLTARDRNCRFPGCRVAAERCELDHIRPFDQGGPTDVDNGICACKRHHRVKHHPGWKIQRFDDNRVEWTSPTGHIPIDHPWNEPDQ